MRRHLLICSLLLAAGPALAVDGLADSTFGVFSSGRNLIAIDQGGLNIDQLAKTLVSDNGTIFLIGTSGTSGTDSHFSITKVLSNGLVDSTFGNNGTVVGAESTAIAKNARFDASGNILIAGSVDPSGTDRDFHLCRYNQLGQPVAFSFLGTHCASVSFNIAGGNKNDVANDLLIEPSGKILLVGTAGVSSDSDRGAIVRFKPDGSRDGLFGTSGKRAYSFTANKINRINAIARQKSGKYIVVGETGDAASADGTGAVFARVTLAGDLDTGFQVGAGFVQFNVNAGSAFNRDEAATEINILPDGSLLMGGTAETGTNSAQHMAFVFKLADEDSASFDTSFGTIGRLNIEDGYSTTLNDLLVQSDGKLVLVTSNRPTSASTSVIEVIRARSTGALDTQTFGNAGRSYISYNLPGALDYGISGAFQFGHIVVGGYSLNTLPANFDITIARLQNDLIFVNGVD